MLNVCIYTYTCEHESLILLSGDLQIGIFKSRKESRPISAGKPFEQCNPTSQLKHA